MTWSRRIPGVCDCGIPDAPKGPEHARGCSIHIVRPLITDEDVERAARAADDALRGQERHVFFDTVRIASRAAIAADRAEVVRRMVEPQALNAARRAMSEPSAIGLHDMKAAMLAALAAAGVGTNG